MAGSSEKSTWWIWCDAQQLRAPNQYVEFRVPFTVDRAPRQAVLRVSVDTDFAAWANGEICGCGQFNDFPQRRTFSEMDVTSHLREGDNVLAFLVHYCGVDHFSHLPGDAGLWFELICDGKVIARSDGATLCRPSPAYRKDMTARITAQRGFTFHFDARENDGWRERSFICGADWTKAHSWAGDAPSSRPVRMLELKQDLSGKVIAQGLLKRVPSTDATIGEQMQMDYLSARRSWDLFDDYPAISSTGAMPVKLSSARLSGADGAYLVIDLGAEAYGLPMLELECTETCAIDVAIGEHLDDLRVRSHIGGRNFASRYVAGPGRQKFVHYVDRYAGRYVQLHVTGLTGSLTLHRIGLVPVEYPLDFAGEFASDDSLANRIWDVSRRTLHLCMGEHYEDCPWREQALYANDSRNQMLAGYYAFGEYNFARVSLDLLAQSTGEDGYQELCAPMKCPITIPSFTIVWFLAMEDYLLFSGDREFVSLHLPLMQRMLDKYLSTLENDLLPCPVGARYWHFYDWASGLDGTDFDDCRKFHEVKATRFDATLNALFVLALRAFARMARWTGNDTLAPRYDESADKVASAAHQAFWHNSHQAYVTYRGADAPEHFAELTQSLAILARIADADRAGLLRKRLISAGNELVPTTLSQSFYKFEAVLGDPGGAAFVRDSILRDWSMMLFAGATSFWETLQGGWDFHHAGSLCHGWSGTPVYFLGAYGLGIKPAAPGFEQVAVHSNLVLPAMRGVIPTPRGKIHVTIEQPLGSSLAIEIPGMPRRSVVCNQRDPVILQPSDGTGTGGAGRDVRD